jgi:hypothetical protein
MRQSWKLAIIGGEVTVLAAFTGLGIHLALQPNRTGFRPPALVIPSGQPASIPQITSRSPSPLAPSLPAPTTNQPFLPDLLRRFGQQDRNLLMEQWTVLQRLAGAIERYIEARVVEQVHVKR